MAAAGVFVMANKGRAEAGKALEAARVAETEAASHRPLIEHPILRARVGYFTFKGKPPTAIAAHV